MAKNIDENVKSGDTSPAEYAFSITPSDSVDLTRTTRGIYVGATGDLKVKLVENETVTFTGIMAGVIHPLRVKRVYATGTTATGIVGVF